MAYTPRGQAWVDGPAAGNAIDAEDLNRIEANQADADARLDAIEGLGSLATDAELAAHVSAGDPHAGYLLESAAPELIRDTMGTALVAGSNVTITPNDAGDTITVAATNTTDAEVVRDTIAAALVAGANVTITPDDTANTITIASSGGGATDPEVVRDTIATALVAGTNVTITPNDGADTITIAASGGGGGASAAAVLVASTDAPTAVKSAAEFVCDGTNDEVQINSAIDLAAALSSRNAGMPGTAQQRGTVCLTGGRFNISASILLRTGVQLIGAGWLTELRAVSLGANHILRLAAASDHVVQVSNLWLNGNFASGGTGNGLDFDMSSSGNTSAYPDTNPDSNHLLTDLLFTGFGNGTRTALHLWASGTANNRGNIIDRIQIRDCGGHGIWLESASDCFVSNTHVGTIGGNGHYMQGGNTKLANVKSFYCDGAGFLFTSGRQIASGVESQDNATGISISGADCALSGVLIDNSSADGLLVSSSGTVVHGLQLLQRSGGRYATATNGVRLSGTLTDLSIVGRINPANITNKFVGTPGARSFVRVSDGATLITSG